MTRDFLGDLAERVVATYIQSFLGLLLADVTTSLSLGAAKVAAIAAIPAALAVIKGALAGLLNGSASLTPTTPGEGS